MNRRNNMKRIAIPLLLSLSLLLSGCQNTDTGSNGGDSASTGAESVATHAFQFAQYAEFARS